MSIRPPLDEETIREISTACAKVVSLTSARSFSTSGRADGASTPAPSILDELEKNNRKLALEVVRWKDAYDSAHDDRLAAFAELRTLRERIAELESLPATTSDCHGDK